MKCVGLGRKRSLESNFGGKGVSSTIEEIEQHVASESLIERENPRQVRACIGGRIRKITFDFL